MFIKNISSSCILRAVLVLVVPALLSVSVGAVAEERLVELKKGMPARDVLKLWGEPVDREEHEVKRKLVWHYPKGAKVIFHEGKVSLWKLSAGAIAERAAREPVQQEVATNDTALNPDTRDLVREIAREVPSGPDVPYTEPPEHAQNIVPPAPPIQQVPQGGGVNQVPPAGVQFYPPVDEE